MKTVLAIVCVCGGFWHIWSQVYRKLLIIHFVQCCMCYYQAVINTDAGRDLCSVEGENGNTPLHSSCQKGDLELAKVSLFYLQFDVLLGAFLCTYLLIHKI